MSLESVVKKSPWYSRLASKVLVPLTFGLASLFGCSYNYDAAEPKKVFINRPTKEQVDSSAKRNPFSSGREFPVNENPDTVAVVTASYILEDVFPLNSNDEFVPYVTRLTKRLSGDFSVEELDEFDGSIDDTLSFYDYVGYYSERDDFSFFDFSSVSSKSDSELIFPRDEWTFSEEFSFDSVRLRDEFISELSKRPVAFGYVMHLARQFSGDDDVFQFNELQSFLVQIDAAINSGKMHSGRGSVVEKDKFDDSFGKKRVWNAYISPVFRITGSPAELAEARNLFVSAGANYNEYVCYDSLVKLASVADALDSRSDGIISAGSIKSLHEKGEFKFDPDMFVSSFESSDQTRLKLWPIYAPLVKFQFYLEQDRNRFVRHILDLPVSKGRITEVALKYVGVDGVFQREEVDNVINEIERLARADRFVDTDGVVYPSSVKSLPSAYITSVIDAGFGSDWKRNAAIFSEFFSKLGLPPRDVLIAATHMDRSDGLSDERIIADTLMTELKNMALETEVLSAVPRPSISLKGSLETHSVDDVCFRFSNAVFFESERLRDRFLADASASVLSPTEVYWLVHHAIGIDYIFNEVEYGAFVEKIRAFEGAKSGNSASRIESDESYFKNRFVVQKKEIATCVLTIDYHFRPAENLATPYQTLRDFCNKQGILGDAFIDVVRTLDGKDGNFDSDVDAQAVRQFTSGVSLDRIPTKPTNQLRERIVGGSYEGYVVSVTYVFESNADAVAFGNAVRSTKVSKCSFLNVQRDVFGNQVSGKVDEFISHVKDLERDKKCYVVDKFGSIEIPEIK